MGVGSGRDECKVETEGGEVSAGDEARLEATVSVHEVHRQNVKDEGRPATRCI